MTRHEETFEVSACPVCEETAPSPGRVAEQCSCGIGLLIRDKGWIDTRFQTCACTCPPPGYKTEDMPIHVPGGTTVYACQLHPHRIMVPRDMTIERIEDGL